MKLFKDYAVLAAGQVAGKVLGFIAFAWLARMLDPAGYGAVEYVVGLTLAFGVLVEGGLSVIGVRAGRDPASLATLALDIPWVRLALAIPCVPALVLLATHFSRSAVPQELAWLFALSLLAIPWRQDWLLQAEERMNEAAFAQLLRAAVFTAIVLALVRLPQDVARTGIAELASAIVFTAYCLYVQQTRITPIRVWGRLTRPRALLKEGAVVGMSTLVFTLHQHAPLFLSAPLAGAVETAWFAAAARVTVALMVFSYLYYYSLYPAVTRYMARSDDALAHLLAASARVTGWAGVLAGLALTLVAERIVVLAFGERMAPAAPVLQILAWTLPLNVFSGHARWTLIARGAQSDVLIAQLAGLATTVVVSVVLGVLLGARGFALAAVSGFVAVWIVAHQRARRLGMRPPSPRIVVKPLAIAACVVAATHAYGVAGWLALAGVVAYVAAAPLIERSLKADLRTLATAKADV